MLRATLFLAFIAVSTASIVHHARGSLPTGWVQNELLSLGEEPISFTFSLRESPESISEIKRIALDVSDPDSVNYGKYLTSSEIASKTSPDAKAFEVVTTWLKAHEIDTFAISGSRIEVATTHERAEMLLRTRFNALSNKALGAAIIRAGDYELPEEVDFHLAAVFGLHGLPIPRAAPPAAPPAPAQPASVTPDVLKSTYGITGVTPSGGLDNIQAVAEFQVNNHLL